MIGTYETALPKPETTRTLTEDSRARVLSMVDPFVADTSRLALLHRAVQTHTIPSCHAATGQGSIVIYSVLNS